MQNRHGLDLGFTDPSPLLQNSASKTEVRDCVFLGYRPAHVFSGKMLPLPRSRLVKGLGLHRIAEETAMKSVANPGIPRDN